MRLQLLYFLLQKFPWGQYLQMKWEYFNIKKIPITTDQYVCFRFQTTFKEHIVCRISADRYLRSRMNNDCSCHEGS